MTDGRDACFAVGDVSQQALFGRVVAVVHHGGAGTITTAARADAPQVVLAQVVDQPYWAGQVAGLRIGTARTTARLRPPAVVPIRLPAAPLEWRYRVSPIWLADTLA